MSADASIAVQDAPIDVEFWRISTVEAKVGFKKSEIYRRIQEGRFPAPRSYSDAPTRKFWTSIEVQRWQREQLGDDFESLL